MSADGDIVRDKLRAARRATGLADWRHEEALAALARLEAEVEECATETNRGDTWQEHARAAEAQRDTLAGALRDIEQRATSGQHAAMLARAALKEAGL